MNDKNSRNWFARFRDGDLQNLTREERLQILNRQSLKATVDANDYS